MYQKIFIAEKPSMAKEIASVLGSPSFKEGYISCENGSVITWCIGHLLNATNPDVLDPVLKTWSHETLPILQERSLRLAPVKGTKKQFDIVKKLLGNNPGVTVVHACDADREGQLICDELLTFCGWKGQTKRLWLNALTKEAIEAGLSSMKDNSHYRGLYDAGVARQVADWNLGINLTRLYTVKAKQAGKDLLISVGRVLTPTLALIVQRDLARENFKPVEHYQLEGLFNFSGKVFSAKWVFPEDLEGLNENGLLISKKPALQLAEQATGNEARILEVQEENKRKLPPLPFDLPGLQKAASSIGFSAAKTLSVAQSLYEKKVTTYPRTECKFLPEELHQKSKKIFLGLKKIAGLDIPDDPDFSIKSAAWNTKKVVAHTGIIPTGVSPDEGLSDDELALLKLISLSFCAQFYKPYTYLQTKISILYAKNIWVALGNRIIDLGWKKVFSDTQKKEEESILPSVSKDETGECTEVKLNEAKTTPPPAFTDGTLVGAMEKVHNFVQDPKLKKLLKENSGIGTPATRASFLERLIKHGYVARSKKQLLSTPLGREVIELVPAKVADPGSTAILEDKLKEIEDGKLDKASFLSSFVGSVKTLVESLKDSDKSFSAAPSFPCPICGTNLKRLKSKEKKSFYWACFETEKHPDNGKKPVFVNDSKGKPDLQNYGKKQEARVDINDLPDCPGCGSKMKPITTKKGQKLFACFEKHEDSKPRFIDPQPNKGGKKK